MNQATEDLILKVDSQLLQTDVEEMLNSNKQLKEILIDIVTWIEYKSENDILTSILLYNKKTNQLFIGAAPSLPDNYNTAVHGITAGPTAGSCGTAAFFRKQIIVDDLKSCVPAGQHLYLVQTMNCSVHSLCIITSPANQHNMISLLLTN